MLMVLRAISFFLAKHLYSGKYMPGVVLQPGVILLVSHVQIQLELLPTTTPLSFYFWLPSPAGCPVRSLSFSTYLC
jgi:hypothetical protein